MDKIQTRPEIATGSLASQAAESVSEALGGRFLPGGFTDSAHFGTAESNAMFFFKAPQKNVRNHGLWRASAAMNILEHLALFWVGGDRKIYIYI